jgi:hypothetical protein
MSLFLSKLPSYNWFAITILSEPREMLILVVLYWYCINRDAIKICNAFIKSCILGIVVFVLFVVKFEYPLSNFLVNDHFHFLVTRLLAIKWDLYTYVLRNLSHYCESHVAMYYFIRYGKRIIIGAINYIILEEKIFKRKRKLRYQVYILIQCSQLTVWSIIWLVQKIINLVYFLDTKVSFDNFIRHEPQYSIQNQIQKTCITSDIAVAAIKLKW